MIFFFSVLANSCFLFCGPALGAGSSSRQPGTGHPHCMLAEEVGGAREMVGWEGKEEDGLE